jgi:hypothetical protein
MVFVIKLHVWPYLLTSLVMSSLAVSGEIECHHVR